MDEHQLSKAATKLLKRATSEITNLRRELEIKDARLNMFDDMMQVINTEPRRMGLGHREDIVTEIVKFITEHGQE